MSKANAAASIFFSLLLTLVLTLPCNAQDTYLPIPSQYRMILKVLEFDKDLQNRGEIIMGILYEKDYSSSVIVKDELVKVMDELTPRYVDGIPIQYIVIKLQSRAALAEAIKRNKINMLYITPMTREDLRPVLKLCNEKKIPTFTGISLFIQLGVAVGFKKQTRKITLLINLAAVKDQGFNLSSRLLHLAEISGTLTKKKETQ